MGAAVITAAGAIVPGALVENISFGLAMCAERAALFTSVAQASGKPVLLALMSARTGSELTWPCGACLQVALELGGPDLIVVASDPDGQHACKRIRELAPNLPFKP